MPRVGPVDQSLAQVVLRALGKASQRPYQNASEVQSEDEKVIERGLGTARVGARTAPEVTANRPGSMPHFGLLTMDGVMLGLGLPRLAVA